MLKVIGRRPQATNNHPGAAAAYKLFFIEKQAEDPHTSWGEMNAVPTAIELEAK